jgi:APA family basic amino acid/polyamine antiporter
MSNGGHQGESPGVLGVTVAGLGTMLATGVFVGIGIATGVAGPAVIVAIPLAAVVGGCSALSSAELAVSGGPSVGGNGYLTRWLGFIAGWVFLLAGAASAATAALGFAGYVLQPFAGGRFSTPLAFVAVVLSTFAVLAGARRPNSTAIALVWVAALLAFVVTGGLAVAAQDLASWSPFFPVHGNPIARLLQATALMFVAFTGAAPLATPGKDVRQPDGTIPRTIMTAVILVVVLSVAAIGIATIGADNLADATKTVTAPLAVAAEAFGGPAIGWVVVVGAVVAMLGAVVNLIVALSRMLLAMGRRHDMPALLARTDEDGSPDFAIVAVGIAIAALVLIGNAGITWSFSAFNALIYGAVTSLAALRLPRDNRLYPPVVAWLGLAACLLLAFSMDRRIWLAGLGIAVIGLVWRAAARLLASVARR